MPLQTAALEPEQQVEQAAAFKAFRYEADLHNAAAEPRSWVFHIRVESTQVHIEHRRRRQIVAVARYAATRRQIKYPAAARASAPTRRVRAWFSTA